VFAVMRETFGDKIDRWGYQESRREYESALADADVVISTAVHEFFGISVVEAIAAGAQPLLPRRLAYPEILGPLGSAADTLFYDGSSGQLVARLESLAVRGHFEFTDAERVRRVTERFEWRRRAGEIDRRLEELAGSA
jgi:glycosyltransferase involved in cell wall biosynthesis